MDGTITRPWLDFKKIRLELALPEPILERMMEMEDGPERSRAWSILERHEREGVEASELNDGARDALDFLGERGISTGLVTRNSPASVKGVLAKHGLAFDVVVTRDDAPVKPAPDSLLLICDRLEVRPAEALMVGDYKYDVMAGQAAGIRTCLLTNGEPTNFEVESDFVISGLPELAALLARHP